MAISYIGAGTLNTGTSSVTAPVHTSTAVGDLIIITAGMKPGTTGGAAMALPSNWIWVRSFGLAGEGGYGSLSGDTGNTYNYAIAKIAESGNLSVATAINFTNANVSWAVCLTFRSTVGWPSPLSNTFSIATGSQSSTPTSSLSISTSPDIDLSSGDALLVSFTIPTDVTTPNQFSNPGLTHSGTSVTLTEVGEPDTNTGFDIGGFVAHGSVTSGSATSQATFTATLAGTLTNVRGPLTIARLREQSPSSLSIGPGLAMMVS